MDTPCTRRISGGAEEPFSYRRTRSPGRPPGAYPRSAPARSTGTLCPLLAAYLIPLLCMLAGGCGSHSSKLSRAGDMTTPAAPAQTRAQASAAPRAHRALAGVVVGIDPGHNGLNYTDPSYLNHLIWNGREWESCDTTGTQTDAGYTESRFNFNVAVYLRRDLETQGARVVMTRSSNRGVGPCVTRRSQIINHAHAAVAIDIHADGGPAGGRGFAVLEPIADGPNNRVIGSSKRFGLDVRRAMLLDTHMPTSTYDGRNGIVFRDDLAGLNLTTVPKVLLESGNMRNATDASMLTSSRFQKREAQALTQAITRFLAGR